MENKLTTKKQEMEALKKIKSIVDALGENSYVATAFEGCFGIAEENIENDFACSMKQRYESEKEKAEALRKEASMLKQKNDSLEIQVGWLKKCLFSEKELPLIMSGISEKLTAQMQRRDKAEKEIVQYAEDTKAEKFKQAVYIHRDALEKVKLFSSLADRIQQIYKTTRELRQKGWIENV